MAEYSSSYTICKQVTLKKPISAFSSFCIWQLWCTRASPEHQEDRVYSGLFCLQCGKVGVLYLLGGGSKWAAVKRWWYTSCGNHRHGDWLSLLWPWEMSTFQKPGKTQNYGSAWWQPSLSVGGSFWKIPTRIYEHQHPEAADFSIILLCKLSSTFSYPALPCWLSGKESAHGVGDRGSIPGLGISPGEGNGNPLQCSCLENPKDRGAWWATVHGITKSWKWLRD